MRPTMPLLVALLLSGSSALAAGPANADSAPHRLSLGDLQGIGIGLRVEPRTAAAPRPVVAPTPAPAGDIVRPLPRPAGLVPAARPPLALRGPFALDADRLQAVALQPVTPVAIGPAARSPAPVAAEGPAVSVAAPAAALSLVVPEPTPAIAEPAGQPLRLGTEALVSVGIGRSAGPTAAGTSPDDASP